MTGLIESINRGPLMTMTPECETEFSRALKDIMLSMGLKGEAVYKGFPVIDEGQEYWWLQLHLYENKGDDHKKFGLHMFTNLVLYISFFDSGRCAAWEAIGRLRERLRFRLHNTQKYLKEVEEELEALKDKMARMKHRTDTQEDMA